MKLFGAIICELLGDPKWTKRLEDIGTKYSNEGDVNKRGRAWALARRNDDEGGNLAQMKNLRKAPNQNYKADYKTFTDRQYPSRKINRIVNNVRTGIDKAKSLLPKSLQK